MEKNTVLLVTIPPVVFQRDPNQNILVSHEIFLKDMPQHNDNTYSVLS